MGIGGTQSTGKSYMEVPRLDTVVSGCGIDVREGS